MINEDGRPEPDNASEILERMFNVAEDAFGRELDKQSAVVLRSYYRPIAEVAAEQQEDIADVVSANQIDYAEGGALDLLASLIGVSRKEDRAATGFAQFSRDSQTTRDYNIPSGTGIQTDASDPVVFETTEQRTLSLYDDFEDNDIAEYTGDTGDFQTQGGTVLDGSYALEGTAGTSEIVNTDENSNRGSVMHSWTRIDSGLRSLTLFGVQDQSNWYGVGVDEANNELRFYISDSGTVNQIDSTAVTVPSSEWLEVVIEWQYNSNFKFVLKDSGGGELAVLNSSDSQGRWNSGGVGFRRDSGTGSVYWDTYSESTVGVPVEATETGQETNVGQNTVVVLRDDPVGIHSVTNWIATSGGRDKEEDDQYRERAKLELNEGMSASQPALVSAIRSVSEEDIRSVNIIENDSSTTDADGRPANSFEPVVDSTTTLYDGIAEAIAFKKAAGSQSVGGYAGSSITRTVEYPNGQTKDISFSEPTPVQIYVDCSLDKTAEYEGDVAVANSIVEYIGGTLAGGGEIQGQLGVSDNVIYNAVLDKIMDVDGVYDVTNLDIGTSADPTGMSNISIGSSETAFGDATDSSLDITSSDA